MLGGDNDAVKSFRDEHVLSYDEPPDVGWYSTFSVKTESLATEPEKEELLIRHAWPKSTAHEIWLIAIDGNGVELGVSEFDLSSSDKVHA